MTTHETGRVLHVMASGARGGGAAHILDLLPELRRIGWDCQAAAGSDGPLASELEALGVPVHPLDLMGRRLGFGRVREAVRLMRTARSLQADVVHIHGTRAAFFHAAARSAVREGPERPSVVYTAHGLAYRKEAWAGERVVSLLAERIACRGADAVMSVSRADLDDLERRGFLGRRPGFHVRNAVRLSEEAGPRRAEARRRLGLPSDGPVVGTVSRLVPQKAVGDLIEAYESQRHSVPDASPVDVLVFLMEQHGLKQADLPEIGAQSVVSDVLGGKRLLNLRQVSALSKRFGISADAFIE